MVVHCKKSCKVSNKLFSTKETILQKNNPNDRTFRSTEDRQERKEIQNPTKTISVKISFTENYRHKILPMVLLRTDEIKKLENQKKIPLKDGFHQKHIEDRINGSTKGNDK